MAIKELATQQEQVIIVTSCLMKDMNGKVDLYRANAIRVLARIVDASMMGTVERFLKQAIVDQNPFVASSALLAGATLFKVAPDVIKRWVGEVQAALNDKAPMVQFHALYLLYLIKKGDRLAVSKLVAGLARNTPRSPYAQVLLVRLANQVLQSDNKSADGAACANFLESCLRNKSDFVNIEAARAICGSPNVTSKELTSAVNSLQIFLTSQKTVLVFAAVRTLSNVAMRYPQVRSTSSPAATIPPHPRLLPLQPLSSLSCVCSLRRLLPAIMKWNSLSHTPTARSQRSRSPPFLRSATRVRSIG